MNQNIERFEEL